jgi:uncharacterized protein
MKRKQKIVTNVVKDNGTNGNGNRIPMPEINGNDKNYVSDKDITFTSNEFRNLISVIDSRSALATRAGKSFGNDRNLYRSLGYKDTLTFEDFWSEFIRENIAKRIIEAYPTDTWRLRPEVVQNEDDTKGKDKKKIDTAFEIKWKELVTKKRLFHYLSRADKLSGIGAYSVLLLGFDDVSEAKGLDEPAEGAKDLLFLRPYKQDNASVHTFDVDITSERYGLPEFYNINLQSGNRVEITNKKPKRAEKRRRKELNTSINKTVKVHWSRILHLAEDLLEDDVNAVPRLQPVFNVLKSLGLIVGGAGEMFWRGAFPGLAFRLDKDAQMDPKQGKTALEEMISKYHHNLQRHLTVQGMEVDSLAPQVADPTNHFDMCISVISATIGIPKRIFLGTERGELASSQDERAWQEKIEERRLNYAEPMILRELINRLMMVGVLPDIKEQYTVIWPPLKVASEKEKMEVSKLATEALAKYADSLDAGNIVPPEIYFKEFLKLEDDVIDQINAIVSVMQVEDEEGREEDDNELNEFRKKARSDERKEEFDKEEDRE